MRRTIYLPNDLADRVEQYLRDHPGVSLSALVRESLDARINPPDPRAILQLAGLVPDASMKAREHEENPFGRHDR